MNRILWNERGKDIDEIVMSNVDIHIEQMSDECWWIGIYSRDDPEKSWMGNFHPKNPRSRTQLSFTQQDNEGIVWDRDDAHNEVTP